jgi:hypothetical protein
MPAMVHAFAADGCGCVGVKMVDSIKLPPPTLITLNDVLTWYKEYKAECWADSSIWDVNEHPYFADSALFGGTWHYDVIQFKKDTLWIPKDHNNLDGFMDFLERKKR